MILLYITCTHDHKHILVMRRIRTDSQSHTMQFMMRVVAIIIINDRRVICKLRIITCVIEYCSRNVIYVHSTRRYM